MTTEAIAADTRGTPMRMHGRTILCAVALAALLAACGDKKAEVADAGPGEPTSASKPAASTVPTTPVAPAVVEAKAPDVGEKMKAYIGCYNRLDSAASRTIARYASWVRNMDSGPTGKEQVVYGLYSVDANAIAKCKAEFAQAAAAKPALAALDAAATRYIDALSALGASVGEAYPYYDRENYKDDKFAKGKELHAALKRDFSAFAAESEKFSAELEVENDKLLAAELTQVEKTEGRKLTYWRMSLMAEAKQLANEVGKADFAVDAATARLATFEKVADEMLAYSAAHKAELPTSWSSLERSAEEFRKAAKERVRRLRDKTPYSSGEKMMLKPGSAWMVEGSQEKAVKAYNSLVESSNRL